MLSQTESYQERRSQSHDLINDLISTRTQMLALYSGLASRKPFEPDETLLEVFEDFCEILVDYTASAHFRLYRYIEEKMEKRQAVLALAETIYPHIMRTTQVIIDFNDAYDAKGAEDMLPGLEHELSKLGEALAERIELEDKLIEVLSASRAKSE